MSRADLDLLEMDVAAARDRVANDIARLRDPSTEAGLRDAVVAKATSVKNELVHQVSVKASDTAHTVWSDIKARASANPSAALAIGAGLAWQMARHPPVATLLVGVGLASLIRTNPAHPSAVANTAGKWAGEAAEIAETTGQRARELAHDLRDHAGQALSEARTATREVLNHGAEWVEDVLPDVEGRDTILIGTAALAIGAAAIIGLARRADEEAQHPSRGEFEFKGS